MTAKQLRKVRARFHELVIAEALGKSAVGDREKLDRYQALLGAPISRESIAFRARLEYQTERQLKLARCIFLHDRKPPEALVKSAFVKVH